MKKAIIIFLTLGLLGVAVSCDDNLRRPVPQGANSPWMEMCSTKYTVDGTTLNPVTHYYTDDKTGIYTRNYTLGYHNGKKIAIWVAYPLCPRFHCGGSRTNAWDWDPKISHSYQVDLSKSYSGYDRGHQLPSYDRTACEAANRQTFYYTNMTAQLGPQFNQDIWQQFEDRVRGWASSCDTMYVVTGCDINGSKTLTKGNQPVPVGYYKALLAYTRPDKWEAMGFYLKHQNYTHQSSYNWGQYAMSIDELERKIGIDFFTNLPDRVGSGSAAVIEAKTPSQASSFWGFQK